jgi:hypothetical protein
MGFFTIKHIPSIDCGRGVGGGKVRVDANAVEGRGIWCGCTISVADVGEGRQGTVEELVAGAVGLLRRCLRREETSGAAVPVAWRLCRMCLAHDLVELKVEFAFWSVVLGELKLQLRRASHVEVVLGACAHHRARAPPKKGRRKWGTRDDVDAIIITLKSWVARSRTTEEWLNRHAVSC